MDGNNQPQQPFQPAPGPAPQPVPPQPGQPFQSAPQPMQPQQPFGTPVGPMGPAGPVGPAPVGAPYQMPPKKGLSKGALWGIIGGIIGLIVLIVGIVLAVVLLGGPSREDFVAFQSQVKDVKEQRKNITDALSDHVEAVFSGRKSDGDLKSALEKYTDSVEKLKSMPALKDQEVKKAYDAFLEEVETTKTYIQGFIDVEKPFLSLYEKCNGSRIAQLRRISDPRTSVIALRDLSKSCSESFDSLASSGVEKIAEYAKQIKDAHDKQVSIMDEMIKAADNADRAAFFRAADRLGSTEDAFLKMISAAKDVISDARSYSTAPKLEYLESAVASKLNK